MDRYQEFSKLMDTLFEGAIIMNKYESKPRTYGTEIKLYMAEIHLLAIINKTQGLTVTELAEGVNKTKSAITQTANKLEEKGLIQKIRSEIYHKEINLYTTDKGKRACEYHEALDRKNYINVMSKLDEFSVEEFQRFMELFRIITDDMKKNENI